MLDRLGETSVPIPLMIFLPSIGDNLLDTAVVLHTTSQCFVDANLNSQRPTLL